MLSLARFIFAAFHDNETKSKSKSYWGVVGGKDD